MKDDELPEGTATIWLPAMVLCMTCNRRIDEIGDYCKRCGADPPSQLARSLVDLEDVIVRDRPL